MAEKACKIKICLVGSESVGKTSFMNRIIFDEFTEDYVPTVGVEFKAYTLSEPIDNIKCSYTIWDQAGQDRYKPKVNTSFRGSHAIIGVYDITRKSTFEELKTLIEEAQKASDANENILLLGNKFDLDGSREVSYDEVLEYANTKNFILSEVSVKNNSNLIEALIKLTQRVIDRVKSPRQIQLYTIAANNIVTTETQVITSSRCQLIDASSNYELISSSLNSRYNGDTRKMIGSLTDQIKLLKAENEKKDKLIAEISAVKDVRVADSTDYDTLLRMERSLVENTRNELELCMSKYESAMNELGSERAKTQIQEEKINSLTTEVEILTGHMSSLNSQIESHVTKIEQLEHEVCSYDTTASKSSITITAIQNDNKQLQERVLELESKLRESQIKIEEIKTTTQTTVTEQVSRMTFNILESIGIKMDFQGVKVNEELIELIKTKFEIINKENSSYKSELNELNEKLIRCELENKANRESILRLTNDLESHERETNSFKCLFEQERKEKESCLTAKLVYQNELEELKEKLFTTQKVWLAATRELETKQGEFTNVEDNKNKLEADYTFTKAKYDLLVKEIAQSLSDDYVKVEPDEREIKEKIQLLMLSSKDRGRLIATMENEILALNVQLTERTSFIKDLNIQYELSLSKLKEFENTKPGLESKINEIITLRDSLKLERAKFYTFINRLAQIFNLAESYESSSPLQLDSNLNSILNKLEQKIKTDIDYRENEKKPEIQRTLEAKINFLNEQLANKDIHLDLLRKKIVDLEECRFGKSELKKESHDHMVINKKLNVKIDKLSRENESLKAENTYLKSTQTDINSLKDKIRNQEDEINHFKFKLKHQTEINDQQTIRIGSLREETDKYDQEINKTRTTSDSAIKALSLELREAKQDLEKSLSRERQLFDFRNLVAKAIGVEVNSLTVADYELIGLIESLVKRVNICSSSHHHVQTITTHHHHVPHPHFHPPPDAHHIAGPCAAIDPGTLHTYTSNSSCSDYVLSNASKSSNTNSSSFNLTKYSTTLSTNN